MADLLVNRKKEITSPDGNPHVKKIVDLVKLELGMTVTRQTIMSYLKEDLSQYLDLTSVEYSNEMKEYDIMMASAKEIWNTFDYKPLDRTKAYNSWLKAKKQREDLERKLQAERIKEAEVRKPTYLVTFTPGHALRKCPKCSHEFYDDVKKVKSDVKKEEG